MNVARGREKGGCEEVRTGADYHCLQRGAFIIMGSELVRVGSCCIFVAVHDASAQYVVQQCTIGLRKLQLPHCRMRFAITRGGYRRLSLIHI